jgi:pimeloyl-[acyl-carrier protein] methyl ester esterase
MQLIAMHGWGSDSRGWAPWQQAAAARGWHWRSGERGYGSLPPHRPTWRRQGTRGVIAHSLGLHLLPVPVLAEAEAVVLLASFGRFVPEGAAGRRWRTALRGMASQLNPEAALPMLRRFLTEAAAPDPVELLPPGPASEPLSPEGLERLRHDLDLLAACQGLPEGFPGRARVLIVEAGADRIVPAPSRAALRESLPAAEVWPQAEAGHALLRTNLVEPVLDWLEKHR